jgi:hypothetical protein
VRRLLQCNGRVLLRVQRQPPEQALLQVVERGLVQGLDMGLVQGLTQ